MAIVRNTPGGKHMILRTVSVSNIQLVRVSDILNSARGSSEGGDSQQQMPPRASSAPPSRQDLIPYVTRPSSVGARIVIPSPSSGPLPSSQTPSPNHNRHFLSEGGDPSAIEDAADASGATTTTTSLQQSNVVHQIPTRPISISSPPPPQQQSIINHHQQQQRYLFVKPNSVIPEASNNNSGSSDEEGEEGCPCNMRAMVACAGCGAFCHQDCVSPNRLCVTCVIR